MADLNVAKFEVGRDSKVNMSFNPLESFKTANFNQNDETKFISFAAGKVEGSMDSLYKPPQVVDV